MKHDVKIPPRATSSSPAMGAHKWSHGIGKAPPRKIRIVHILAPEIIKTDVENFRHVVQRLTGKPVASDGDGSSASESAAQHPDLPVTASREGAAAVVPRAAATIKAEVKEEAEAPSGGLLRALGDDSSNGLLPSLDDLLLEEFLCSSSLDDLLLEDFLCSSSNVEGLMSEF